MQLSNFKHTNYPQSSIANNVFIHNSQMQSSVRPNIVDEQLFFYIYHYHI